MEYTKEQLEDIKLRGEKVVEFIKSMELEIAAQISAQNVGNDVFGLKVKPYLRNTKYTLKSATSANVPSPEMATEPTITDVEATPINTPTIDPVNPQP